MKHTIRRIAPILALALLFALCLSACGGDPSAAPGKPAEPTAAPVPTIDLGGSFVPEDATELRLKAADFDFDTLLAALPELSGVKRIALDETTLTPEQIGQLAASRSGLTVEYSVAIGENSYGADETALDLSGVAPADLPAALEKLPLLPKVSHVTLSDADGVTQLGADELAALREALPDAELQYTVSIGGQIYPGEATHVTLTDADADDLAAALEQLRLLPDLTGVELMGADGTSPFSKQEVRAIMDAVPGADVHYEFDLFGQHLTTADRRVVFDSVEIGNEGEQEIRAALDILPKCTYFLLDSCGIDNEVMASIRDDYPDKQIVWRVFISFFNMLTDEQIIRVTFELNDENCEPLNYCTECVYLDVGHNSTLTDCSFVQYMPKLECVILSGSSVQDVSYFANCKNLIWTELCFCGWLKDISVFADHPTMKYLNISSTSVSDISALDNVALDRLNCMNARVDYASQRHFIELHPDCISVFEGKQPYGYGWRYNDHGVTFFDYYKHMREVFLYGEKGYYGNHKGSAFDPSYLWDRPGYEGEIPENYRIPEES